MSLDTPTLPHSHKILDTKCFLLTISVPGDLSQRCIDAVVKWIRKSTIHAYCVTETGESDRIHLHAVLVFSAPRMWRKIRETVFDRYVKPNHPDAKGFVAVVGSVQYNHDWYDTYLQKETNATVLIDTYDRDRVTDYFPTVEVQEVLQTKSEARRSGDPIMMTHLQRWTDRSPDDSTSMSALTYFKWRMYDARDMQIIVDGRKLVQKAYALYQLRNRIVEPNAYEIRLLTEQDATFQFN